MVDTIMNILGVHRDTYLPLAEESEEEKAELAGLRVLLAEDNAVNQQIAGEILESEKVRLSFANNGEEAVKLLMASAPGAFDLVLMDLQMPVMDGFAATRAIRGVESFHPLRLPIIAMTAHSDVAEISACFDAGMNDHTGKPIIIDKFFAAIRRWLPPRARDAAVLAEAVPALRLAAGKGDAASRKEVEALLEKLVPVLHEGRVGILRTALLEGCAEGASAALAALDAVTADLAGGDAA
jgi:CheY-like chemotaxis protein